MKKPIFTSSLAAAALFGAICGMPAFAQHTDTPRIDQAQQELRERIDHGIATGRITPHEARDLYRREREIRFMETAMKRDGVVHPEERRQLRHELDGLSSEVERRLSGRRATTHADLHAPGIERGKDHIRERISEGLRSGHITRWEAQKLYERERHLAQHEAAARADGMLSRDERHHLRSEIAMLSDEVDRMIDNDRRRHAR